MGITYWSTCKSFEFNIPETLFGYNTEKVFVTYSSIPKRNNLSFCMVFTRVSHDKRITGTLDKHLIKTLDNNCKCHKFRCTQCHTQVNFFHGRPESFHWVTPWKNITSPCFSTFNFYVMISMVIDTLLMLSSSVYEYSFL